LYRDLRLFIFFSSSPMSVFKIAAISCIPFYVFLFLNYVFFVLHRHILTPFYLL
jgi:hypothetical protein